MINNNNIKRDIQKKRKEKMYENELISFFHHYPLEKEFSNLSIKYCALNKTSSILKVYLFHDNKYLSIDKKEKKILEKKINYLISKKTKYFLISTSLFRIVPDVQFEIEDSTDLEEIEEIIKKINKRC